MMLTADRDRRMEMIKLNVEQALLADPAQPVAALLARHLDPARIDAVFAGLCRVAGRRLVELKSGKPCP